MIFDLESVSCPTDTACFAAGESGTILASRNGGATWGSLSSGTPLHISGISCPRADTCFASTDGGDVLVTRDGGAT